MRTCAGPDCEIDISQRRADAKFCSTRCSMRSRVAEGRITPALRREQRLRYTYGITVEQYEQMLADQGGTCALCDRRPEDERYGILPVDHCHDTGKIRGLLCQNHNLGIGSFKDNPSILRAAADYIERFAS